MYIKAYLILLITVVLLVSCAKGIENPVSTNAATETLIPKLTATSTFLPTPDLTLTHEQIIEGLFRENGNCELPCWWGVSPGDTSWESAYEFLTPISKSIRRFVIDPNRIVYLALIEVPEEIEKSGIIGIEFGVDENGIVNAIWTQDNWIIDSPDYTVYGLLHRLGRPREIKIFAEVSTPIGPIYSIAMLYPGIMVHRSGYGRLVGEEIEVCPAELTAASRLWLWPAEKEKQFEDLATGLLFREGQNEYRDLAMISSLDIDTFYETFSFEAKSSCFNITSEPWY